MKLKQLAFGIALGVAVLAAPAHAAINGTDANTLVENFATVNYSVAGVPQTAEVSNTDSFRVDRRINLSVDEVGNNFNTGFDSASPSTNQSLTFTVTNLTNAPLDFGLSYTQDTTGTAGPAAPHIANGATDDFDTTFVGFYLDDADGDPATVDGNGIFDGTDILVTFLDEIPADVTRTVHVVNNIPAGQTSGFTSSGSLTAQAREPGTAGAQGAIVAQTPLTDPENQNSVETVFGDADTTAKDANGPGNGERDGMDSDDDAYRIAGLTVAKSSRVVTDPFNCTIAGDASSCGTNVPRRVPGAVLEYCIEIANGFSTAVTGVSAGDDLTGDPVTFVSGSIMTASSDCALNDGAPEDDNATDDAGDEADPNGGNFAGATVTGSFPSIPASETRRLQFRVTIN